jgi:hypothetical protein
MPQSDDCPETSLSLDDDDEAEVIGMVIRMVKENRNPGFIKHLREVLSLLQAHHASLREAMSDASKFQSMGQLEQLMLDLSAKFNDANLKALINEMKEVKAEAEIVAQKKNCYLQRHGVRLRNYSRSATTVMTLVGKVNYERMSLAPSRPSDKAALSGLGIRGYVYPLDEALLLSRLPFKMTVGLMLEIAKESSRCESYEEAERILAKRGRVYVNDDTMRQVTNAVGAIVFNNDVSAAERVWRCLGSGGLELGQPEREGALYLVVGGAMLPTRQKGKKGSIGKESKLGMAFSTENIHWWTDNDGIDQYIINKKEYTALIEDDNCFNKLMFNVALRNGYGKFPITVLISNGENWIREMKEKIFPDAQQILDFYRLDKNITEYFKNIYNNQDEYNTKSKIISNLFYESNKNKAFKLLKKSLKKENKTELYKLLEFIENNRDSINYAEYRSKNYLISTGNMERTDKIIFQRRLKFGAMRWHVPSAQSVATLVAKARSGLWESDVAKATRLYYGQSGPRAGAREHHGALAKTRFF